LPSTPRRITPLLVRPILLSFPTGSMS
jgi:hypothetical protein